MILYNQQTLQFQKNTRLKQSDAGYSQSGLSRLSWKWRYFIFQEVNGHNEVFKCIYT